MDIKAPAESEGNCERRRSVQSSFRFRRALTITVASALAATGLVSGVSSTAQATSSLAVTSARAGIAPQTADLSVWGAATTLSQPLGFGMDSAGRQYVSLNTGPGILVFASDAIGNASPIASFSSGSDTINSIAFDAAGGIWASARSVGVPPYRIYYFAPLAAGYNNSAPISPTRVVEIPNPAQAIGISPQQKLVIMDDAYLSPPRHIRTYDLPTALAPSPSPSPSSTPTTTLGPVNQVSVNGSMVDLDMTEPGGAYVGAQIAFDAQGNILVGGDSGNVYLLPKEGYGLVGSSTAVPLKTWGGNLNIDGDGPVGVAFTSDGRVLVTTYGYDGVGVRIFSASVSGSVPSATVEVDAASHTNATRGIGLSPDGSLIKFAALSSHAIGVLALPAAPSPSPSPTQGSGGGTGGGGEVATPSPTPTPTPTPTVSTSIAPTAAPSPRPTATPAPSAIVPAGVQLLSGTERANAQVLPVTSPVSTSAVNAPEVTVPAGTAVAPVVSGLPPNTPLQAGMSVVPLMRAKGSYVPIGVTRSTASGRAKVPAFKASRAGIYTIRLSTPAGKAFYLKVKVTPKKASSTSGSSRKASGRSSR